jgi:hypothetical protein
VKKAYAFFSAVSAFLISVFRTSIVSSSKGKLPFVQAYLASL